MELYKTHYNAELFELCRDYEINIHKRELDSASRKFTSDFMAKSPLFDPNNETEAALASTPLDSELTNE